MHQADKWVYMAVCMKILEVARLENDRATHPESSHERILFEPYVQLSQSKPGQLLFFLFPELSRVCPHIWAYIQYHTIRSMILVSNAPSTLTYLPGL